MKKIELNKGKFVLVDDSDFGQIDEFHWHAELLMKSHWYAFTSINGKSISMHRLLMNPSKGQEIDHINGNGLDNRQENLRICSHLENMRNRKLHKNNKSGVKGVYRSDNKWRVQIRVNKKAIEIGQFLNLEDARIARNLAARKYFGKFANE